MRLRRSLSVFLAVVLGIQPLAAASSITGLTISPGAISFSSIDPDLSPVNGSATASVQWSMDGNNTGNWTLTVQSSSSTLINCSEIPVSAIKLQCTSLAKSGASNPAGNCASGVLTLSTNPQVIASGNRQGSSSTFTASIASTFTDSWTYIPNTSCSAQLTYIVNAQ